MRKITEQIIHAFLNGEEKRIGNDYTNGSMLQLHGNTIAIRNDIDGMRISNAGWFSNTTKERLNGLPGVSISQKAGVWYLNGKAWDGRWINPATFGNV